MDLSHSHAITELANEGHIRAAARPKCILCGCEGQSIYSGQKDRLFGIVGSWDFKICSNRKCGLIWLDPMPLAGDIGKAYTNYYTHSKRDQAERVGLLKRIYRLMKRGYWASKYNYQIGPGAFPVKTIGKFLYLFPLRRSEVEADIRHLEAVPQGRLLDVGCGSGEWLATMRELGWLVEGCDFDKHAVGIARQRGLKVNCGSLEEQNYPDKSFDAVTLNHVIEHVPDPLHTLAECGRILKPGGKLVLFTPNNASLGHRIFKESWRGLEPPRHLHVFSMQSMRCVLAAAGFQKVLVQPFVVTSVIYESILLRWGWSRFTRGTPRNWTAWGITRLFKFMELCALKWDPSLGDCVIAVATKQ
jgi:2-polyprenyl-3-methyl-5-hydroxy-6-metoxy-1,4-benzoquinol methylase